MAEQLRRIDKEARKPGTTVQIIPFRTGYHTGLDGPYMILEFPKANAVVHLEHKRSGIFVDDPSVVEVFMDATATLQDVALSPDDSRAFLVAVAQEYEQQE
jgi:hypothetical protein